MTANAGWDISLWDAGKWDEILLIGDSGSYSLSFANVYSTRAITLSTTVADFNISSQYAALLSGRVDVVDPANLSIFGPNSGLLKGSLVDVLPESYTLTPLNVSLYKTWGLDTQPASYTIAGSNAELISTYLLETGAGEYVIDTADVETSRSYVLSTGVGEFQLDGLSADLKIDIAPQRGQLHHFSAHHFLARHFAAQHLRGADAVPVVLVSKHGGDDAFHEHKHVGWDKKQWEKKKQREELFAETIAKTYEQIMGIAPTVEVVQEVAKQAVAEKPTIIQKPYVNYAGLEDWLQSQQQLVKLIIQKRIEAEDEEDIEMLLLY